MALPPLAGRFLHGLSALLPRYDEPRLLSAQMELIDQSFGMAMLGCSLAAIILGAGLALTGCLLYTSDAADDLLTV